jgi:hypothetical protein
MGAGVQQDHIERAFFAEGDFLPPSLGRSCRACGSYPFDARHGVVKREVNAENVSVDPPD